MAEFQFPNESPEYRAARNELLAMEKALRALGDSVARKRRALPLGGKLKEPYRFEQVGADNAVHGVGFAELFGDQRSLLVYSMMFGPEWDAACPSCTSLVDAFNANYHAVSRHCAMAVVAAATPDQLHRWVEFRGWNIPVLSAAGNCYILDYSAVATSDPAMVSMMNAFRRTPDGIFHTWGSELVSHPMDNGHPRHVDSVWPFWNLLDMAPDGRPDRSIPIQDYRHNYFTEHVFREPD